MSESEDVDVNSILLANWYLVTQRGENNTELSRKYLTMKIDKALNNRIHKQQINKIPTK